MGDAQRAGGNRGGRDQFKWEDIKEQRYIDREQYLGHAVMAPQGRWQNGKDLGWYARSRKDESFATLQEEKRRAKQLEENMLQAADDLDFERAAELRDRLEELTNPDARTSEGAKTKAGTPGSRAGRTGRKRRG